MTSVRDVSIGELKHNAVYGALGMPWATLVGQIASAMQSVNEGAIQLRHGSRKQAQSPGFGSSAST
jgi:hypothetical protein